MSIMQITKKNFFDFYIYLYYCWFYLNNFLNDGLGLGMGYCKGNLNSSNWCGKGKGSQLCLNFNIITKFIMKNGVINEKRGKLNSSKWSFFIWGWGEKVFKSSNLG
jgi:hypothetical protein